MAFKDYEKAGLKRTNELRQLHEDTGDLRLSSDLCKSAQVTWHFGYELVRLFLYFDHFHIFYHFCTSTHRHYFDLNFTSASLLRPKLYVDLCFSTNNKSTFDKRSKYRGRST